MIDFKKNKIGFSLLLVSVVLIIFAIILEEKIWVPIEFNEYGTVLDSEEQKFIQFLGIQLPYNNTIFFLFISVIFSILTLIFVDDNAIDKKSKKLWNLIANLKLSNHYVLTTVVSIVLFIFILIFGGRCSNKTESESTIVYEDTIIAIDTSAVIPFDDDAEIRINDSIRLIENNRQNNSKDKNELSDYERVKKDIQEHPDVNVAGSSGQGMSIEELRSKY